MDNVKFITVCEVLNYKQNPSTYIYIFICPSDAEMNVTHSWKILAFKFYNN